MTERKKPDEVRQAQDQVFRDALRLVRANLRAQEVETEGLSDAARFRHRRTLRNSAAMGAYALDRVADLLWWDVPPKTGKPSPW